MTNLEAPSYLDAAQVAWFHSLPESRQRDFLTAMDEDMACFEHRAIRLPRDPERRKVFVQAMNSRPCPLPMDPPITVAIEDDREEELAFLDAVEAIYGEPDKITDRDMARSGSVG